MSWIKMWVFERQFPALMCVKKLNSTYQIPTPKICTGFDFVKNSSNRREMGIFFRQMNQFNNLHFYRYLIMQKKTQNLLLHDFRQSPSVG